MLLRGISIDYISQCWSPMVKRHDMCLRIKLDGSIPAIWYFYKSKGVASHEWVKVYHLRPLLSISFSFTPSLSPLLYGSFANGVAFGLYWSTLASSTTSQGKSGPSRDRVGASAKQTRCKEGYRHPVMEIELMVAENRIEEAELKIFQLEWELPSIRL